MKIRDLINEFINPYLVGTIKIYDDSNDLVYEGDPDKDMPSLHVLNLSVRCIYPINDSISGINCN